MGGMLVEISLRLRGFTPAIVDSLLVWAQERAKLDQPATRRMVAILGDSRAQCDLSAGALRSELPGSQLAQLATPAASSLDALTDLADHSSFSGTVLCAGNPEFLAWGLSQQDRVQFYHGTYKRIACLNRRANAWLGQQVQSRLALCLGAEALRNLVPRVAKSAWTGRRISPPFQCTAPDRFASCRFASLDAAEVTRLQTSFARQADSLAARARGDPPGRWDETLSQLQDAATKIGSRGGAVVMVHYPTSGAVQATCESAFPRTRFWDRYRSLDGVHAIHWQDLDGVAGICMPDFSHLDVGDTVPFTGALGRRLRTVLGLDSCVAGTIGPTK